MRIDSCRKCGSELEIKQKYRMCNEALKFSCVQCHFDSEEQVHSVCRTIDFNQKDLAAKVT